MTDVAEIERVGRCGEVHRMRYGAVHTLQVYEQKSFVDICRISEPYLV